MKRFVSKEQEAELEALRNFLGWTPTLEELAAEAMSQGRLIEAVNTAHRRVCNGMAATPHLQRHGLPALNELRAKTTRTC